MSLSYKWSYLLDSIMQLSQIISTMISTVEFERNNLSFTIEDFLKGEFNWNMYEITPPCYAINACILYPLCLNNMVFLKEHLVGYTHANFHHATTFGCRNMAFQIWWLPWDTQRSNWPKTFCGQCIFPFSYTNFWSSEFVIIFFMKSLQDSRVQEIDGCCFLFTFLWLSFAEGAFL